MFKTKCVKFNWSTLKKYLKIKREKSGFFEKRKEFLM
jgi:hypothetical protein